ncbi:hypothetical protein B0H11DRAFT_2050939 [Mycena galericulata]|nr:hypothetical protein B0H11DRAFT_2050939 [Mycena galericulata]
MSSLSPDTIDMELNSSLLEQEPQGRAPDEAYFFADGDCVFLTADGVLFQVHKWALSRDPESMFRDMFGIPRGPQAKILDPIPLPDSADEFRALCWVAYALPSEIYAQTTHGADVPKLVDVAKMCHKYTLPRFESWALKMLVVQCQEPLNYLGTCTQHVLDQIMAVSYLCGHTELLRLAEAACLPRLDAGELQWCDALSAGERYGRRQFQGEVYYRLNKALHAKPSTLSLERRFSHLNLTDTQLLRLLSGHVLLSRFWDHLRWNPVPVLGASCILRGFQHDPSCEASWLHIEWPSDTSDVFMGLKSIADVQNGPLKAFFCVEKYLDSLVAKFISNDMANYFLGPETPNSPTS